MRGIRIWEVRKANKYYKEGGHDCNSDINKGELYEYMVYSKNSYGDHAIVRRCHKCVADLDEDYKNKLEIKRVKRVIEKENKAKWQEFLNKRKGVNHKQSKYSTTTDYKKFL